MILKPPQLVEPFEFVYRADPALDTEVEDFDDRYKRFQDTHDIKQLPLKPGQEPVVWKLKHLYGEARAHLNTFMQKTMVRESISDEAVIKAAKMSLVDVVGLSDDRGKTFEIERYRDAESRQEFVSEKCMQWLYPIDDGGLVYSLGVAAIVAIANPKK